MLSIPVRKKVFDIFCMQQNGLRARLNHVQIKPGAHGRQAFAPFDKKALQHGQK